jgi:hypothetical protein
MLVIFFNRSTCLLEFFSINVPEILLYHVVVLEDLQGVCALNFSSLMYMLILVWFYF